MKKFWSKSCTLALAFIMLCSAFAGVPLQMVTATDGTETLEDVLVVDNDIELAGGGYFLQDGSNRVEIADWNSVMTEKTAENGTFSFTQSKSSAWQSRLYFNTPQIQSDKETVIETRFKVEAAGDANGKSLPQAKITFYANGGVYDNNTALTYSPAGEEEVWHTYRVTLSPDGRTAVATLDNVNVTTVTYNEGNPFANFGFGWQAWNQGTDMDNKDINNQVNTAQQTLDVPIKWTFDYFKVTQQSEGGPTPTPDPGAEIERTELFSLDESIMLHNNQANIIKEDGAEYALWKAEDVIMQNPVISEDQSQFSVKLGRTSAWSARLNIRNLRGDNFMPASDTYLEVVAKVKITPDTESDTPPTVSMSLDGNSVISGRTFNSGALSLSSATEEKWHTIRYVINPNDGTAVCYVDEVQTNTADLDITADNYSVLGLYPIVQNAGESGNDNQDLAIPVTWTFDSVKVNELTVTGGTTPTPEPSGRTTLFKIDSFDSEFNRNPSYNRIITGDGVQMEYIDWASAVVDNDLSAVDNGSSLQMVQRNTAEWQQRMWLTNSSAKFTIDPDVTTTLEVKFKVKADDYGVTDLPEVKFIGAIGGTYIEFPENSSVTLSEEMAEEEQVLKYVIDPAAQTLSVLLNGQQVASQSFSNISAEFGPIGFYPVVMNTGETHEQNIADGKGQGNQGSDKTEGFALTTPVTWTFNSIELYQGEGEPQPTPTPTPVPETGDMLLIDDAMELDSAKTTLTQGDSQITQLNYRNTVNSLSSDNSTFIVSQSNSSAYNNRFQIIQPDYYSMDKITVFETQFKVKTQSGVYDGTEPQLGFMFDSDVAGYVTSTLGQVALSAETEDVWQKVRFIVNPSTRQVTSEINGVAGAPISFASTAPSDVFGNMMFRLIALNNGVGVNDATADTEALTSPIEWTFDYFKTYQEDFPKETGDLLVIDKNMRLEGGVNLKEGNYHIFDNYYAEEEQEPGVANTDPAKKFVLLNADEEEIGAEGPGEYYMMQQSHVSKYQHAMGITSPAEILMDNEINFEIKFKLRAADYSQNTYAKFMLVWRPAGPGTQAYFYEMNTNIPLTAESADVLQTVVFTVDPEAETITAKLNGNEVGSYPFTTNDADKPNFDVDTMQAVYIYPVAQLSGGTGEDSTDLGNTLTWIYDSFRIYKPDGEEVEPTPPPVYDPLAEAVSSGAFSSEEHESGTGKDDTKQLFSKTISLGDEAALINKLELDHDSSQIMSYSFEYSPDGLTYHPLTIAYPGEVDTYSGQQTFRFAPVPARFVRYNATLLEKKDTQARVNDVTISYVDTTELNLSALPGSVNPVLTDEVVLKAVATDSAQDTYTMPNEGVVWSINDGAPDGVTLDGTSLRFAKTTAAGQVTVTATDASSDTVVSTKTIQIVPQVAARNFALYADADGTTPITSLQAGSTVYARAEVLATEALAQKGIQLTLGAYRDETAESSGEELIAVATPVIQDAPTDDYAPVTVSLTLPDDFKDGDYIRAFIWEKDSVQPLADSISYGLAGGQSVADVFLKKSGTFTATAAGATTWETADDYVATVENGVITANHEGNTVITAKNGEQVIATIPVRVKAGMYVFLSLGQSNMSGTNNPDLEGVDVSEISDNVMLLNGENEFEPAQHPYRRYSGVNYIGGNAGDDDKVTAEGFRIMGWADAQEGTGTDQGINMTYSFSEDLADARPDIQIGLVQNSSSGSSVLTYEIDAVERGATNANGFVSNVERMTAALEGTDAEWKGILYHQGESDSQVNVYPTHLRNMIYDLKSALGEMEVPFIMGGLSENNRSVYVTANARNRQEMLRIPFSTFVSSTEPEMLNTRAENEVYGSGVYLEDYTHISAKGQIEFGHRYYAAFTELINKIKR